MGNRRVAGSGWLWPARVRVADQRQRTTWLDDVIDGFRDLLAVGPVERLAERYELERPQIKRGNTLAARLHPPNIVDPCFGGATYPFGQHLSVGIEANDLVEAVGQLDSEYTRAASDI